MNNTNMSVFGTANQIKNSISSEIKLKFYANNCKPNKLDNYVMFNVCYGIILKQFNSFITLFSICVEHVSMHKQIPFELKNNSFRV